MTSPYGFRALRAAVVEADAHRSSFHVATADDEHRVNTQFFCVGDSRLERRGTEIGFRAPHVRAEFAHDGFGVINQCRFFLERDDILSARPSFAFASPETREGKSRGSHS